MQLPTYTSHWQWYAVRYCWHATNKQINCLLFPQLHSGCLVLPELLVPPACPPPFLPSTWHPSCILPLCVSTSSDWLLGSSTLGSPHLGSPHLDYGFWTCLRFWCFVRTASNNEPATALTSLCLALNKPGYLEYSVLVLF